jgi:hypothetical protein
MELIQVTVTGITYLDGRPFIGTGLTRVLGHLKRALRMEQRPTIEQLLQLAEAIFDYGLTIQAYEKWSGSPPPYIIVEIPELALQFRKTPKTIKDTLLLLRVMGRAEPLDCHEHWKLKLADTPSSRKDERAA